MKERERETEREREFPTQEWRIVIECDASYSTGHRRIPDYRELLATERSRRAGLTACEIIAIVLYTGPMVGAGERQREGEK